MCPAHLQCINMRVCTHQCGCQHGPAQSLSRCVFGVRHQCHAMIPSSTLVPLYRRPDCSGITKLGRRVWRAEVLHQQGRCLLVEPWLPLHQRLIQELHSIPSQFGLLRPLQQPPITESTCTGDTDCRFQIQAWSWVIRHLPAAAPEHHTCLPHWDEVSGLATSMMSHHP